MNIAKKQLKQIFSFLIITNTLLFLLLAYFHLLSTAPEDMVFVDFWGRFTVYSLWFIGFTVYVKYLVGIKIIKWLVLSAVCLNIPLFLLLAYFDKISNAPDTLVFIDFWGRITVYSLWFICYELYKKYVDEEQLAT